jgi:hypothetical protein
MRNFTIGALGALLSAACAVGVQAATIEAAPGSSFTTAAIRLVGDGGGTDARNTTSVYDGGKSPFDPAHPESRTKTPLERTRGRAVASGAVHSANRPTDAVADPNAPAAK